MSPLMRVVRAKPFMIPVGTLLPFLPWFVLLGWMAEASWFLTDDAFISFRYARNLLSGHGLVYNPGEYVEGYSNFLWVLELALLWGIFGLRPEHAAPWLSVAFTAGTISAILWWVARLPALRHRVLVGWMALGLVCSSATFAVWTSGGGLETRQFTFFVVLAVVCLNLYRDSRRCLLVVSLSLAAAALTRPEGPLIAICCFGWFAMEHVVRDGRLRLPWGKLACLVGPFVVLVAAHFLFRYAYYGEWLPNTYYAKHVRPWYEAGFRYLWAAALETGLYLLLPSAVVSLVKGWRRRRCLTYALPLLCIVSHLGYVARIGGDHFEYRPLDFYWPLLAVPAAEGIVGLGAMISGRLRRSVSDQWKSGAGAFLLFIPIVFYSNVIQGFLLIERTKYRTFSESLDEENAGWLLAAPGMSVLAASIVHLNMQLSPHVIARRAAAFRDSTEYRIRAFRPYESVDWDMFPQDAVTALTGAGVLPFYAYGLTVIDKYGLNDATIARNPVSRPNHHRRIAHDRSPPAGYLEQRGVNLYLRPAVSSTAELPIRSEYALRIRSDLWMPFDSTDHQWVINNFAGRNLRYNHFSNADPSDNRFYFGPDLELFVGERFLGRYEDGFDGWLLEGDAFTKGQSPVGGSVGPGFLTSYHPGRGDASTGMARSPKFTATNDQLLAFLIGGGKHKGTEVRLLADGDVVWSRLGNGCNCFEAVVLPFADVSDKTLQLELIDLETRDFGRIMLDHVILGRLEDTRWRPDNER